jgi:hypothetical protein
MFCGGIFLIRDFLKDFSINLGKLLGKFVAILLFFEVLNPLGAELL